MKENIEIGTDEDGTNTPGITKSVNDVVTSTKSGLPFDRNCIICFGAGSYTKNHYDTSVSQVKCPKCNP